MKFLCTNGGTRCMFQAVLAVAACVSAIAVPVDPASAAVAADAGQGVAIDQPAESQPAAAGEATTRTKKR